VKIKIIDAFGTHVGDAEVTWLPVDMSVSGFESMDDSVRAIFDPEITVLLPPKNVHMAWRLEVTP
jgi:hypothetical protein